MKEKSISSCLSNSLRFFDYFGVTFEFRVDKKSRYRSSLGGCIFILFLISSLGYFLKSLLDYITFTETKIKFYEKSLDPGVELNFSEMNFSYAVQITLDDLYNTPINNTQYADMFKISHKFVVKNLSKNFNNYTQSYPRSCNTGDFSEELLEYPILKRQNLSSFNCFDYDKNFSLQGVYTNEIMKYSEILISINDKYLNSSDLSKTMRYIRKAFNENNFKFTLYYVDTFDDLSNKFKPVTYKIDAIYTYIDLYNFKKFNVFFQEFQFEFDKNLFFINYIKNKFINLFKVEEISSPIKDRIFSNIDKGFLLKFYLRSINYQKIVFMSYIKIPEFLASLNALLINTLFLLKIILYYFNHFEAKQSIINKIMKYKDIIKSYNRKTLNYLYENIVDDKLKSRISFNNNNLPDEAKKRLIIFSNKNLVNYKDHCTMENIDFNKFNKNYYSEKIISINDSMEEKFLYEEKNRDLTKKNFEKSYSSLTYNNLPFENIEDNSKGIVPQNVINEIYINKRKNEDFSYKNQITKRDDSSKENQKISISKNPFGLLTIDICRILLCFCYKSKKHKVFEIAENKFNHNIDLINYMKKIQELDILKYLILDENTLQLMNFISKPCISMSNHKIKDEEYKLFFDQYENNISLTYKNIDNVKKSYDHITNKTCRSNIEERVLKLFELQIKEIFE